MTFDPPQLEAIRFLAVRRRGFVKSPAGSGKTLIAAGALAAVTGRRQRERPVRVGWLANTIEQCQQAFKALVVIYTDEEVGLAQAEARWNEVVRDKRLQLDVKIRCAAADTDWSDRDVLVVDEAHHSLAPQWETQIRRCTGAIWGFSATPPVDEIEFEALLRLYGEQFFEVTRQQVAGRLAPAKVYMLDAFDDGLGSRIDALIADEFNRRKRFWGGDVGQLWSQVAWGVVAEHGIFGNHKRNDAAVALAKHHGRDQVLLLVNKVEHGEMLAARIANSRMCHSKMGKKKRRETLEQFKAGTVKCIVATSLADEGLDIPNANVLILASGGRSSARAEQRTGRVLRKFSGKTHGLIYDFLDAGQDLMAKHAQARLALYRQLGYEIAGELNL